ncbi:hypothetical protein ACFL5W_00450 [Thermodesulfobacteriota bacterium]
MGRPRSKSIVQLRYNKQDESVCEGAIMQAKTMVIEDRSRRRYLGVTFLLLSVMMVLKVIGAHGAVIREAGKTYIVDQTGERWDVSQAQELGFDAEGFQYGIGKNAFQTLDNRSLSDETRGIKKELRVIGVAGAKEAQAYSVPKLRYHEIANTHIDAEPIAVGY